MTPEEIKQARLHRKRLARMRFKSIVRQVAANRMWLNEFEETSMGENVRRNVAIIVRRKGRKSILTLGEKSLLNTPVEWRTIEQRKAIVMILASLKCFSDYPPVIRCRLAPVTSFQFFKQGRTILREGHHASAMYFVLDGEVTATRRVFDKITKNWYEEPIMAFGPGDVFGEDSLLLDSKRPATCTTAVNTELLCVYKKDFDAILKDALQTQWDNIRLSLNRFTYLKDFNSQQIQECCVLAKIVQFKPLQTIYAEDQGRLNFVFFVLSGTCSILQCLKMNYDPTQKCKHYQLEAIEKNVFSQSANLINKINLDAQQMRQTIAVEHERANMHQPETDTISSSRSSSLTQEKAQHIEFVEVGTYTAGSVFGLGEKMEHRTIVAQKYVQCLMIPRFWLFQRKQNKGNVWQRTNMNLNSAVPSRQKVFDDFLSKNQWMAYKSKVVADLQKRLNVKNTTTLNDVPVICRIDNGF